MAVQEKAKYDVGVVGVGVGANYGSVLTYYSLYKTIESFGKKVLMVTKIGADANDPELKNNHAATFAKKHYNLSKLYSQATVSELNDLVDNFVLGSDQVWNYGISRNFGKAFYLDFARDDKRKISYAASFGHEKDFAPSEEIPAISALMGRFNAVSVREDSGVRLLREVYNIRGRQVAEPIFLSDLATYKKLATESDRDVSGPYLLAYILDPTPEKKAAIEHIAQRLNLRVRVILDAWPHLIKENKAKMDMGDAVEDGVDTYGFLRLYENSSYVLTDSFHGTAFALKFEKPFASIGNRRRGVTRFDSMFRLIGNRERFTLAAENIIKRENDFLAPMDYATITKTLDDHAADSKAWLKASLEMPVTDTVAKRAAAAPPSKASPIAMPAVTLRQSSHILARVARQFRHLLHRQSYNLVAPNFTSNSDMWQIEKQSGVTRLTMTSQDPGRGKLAWTDFPKALEAGAGYELTIDWVLRSAVQTINLHIRHPQTGAFRVIGAIQTGKAVNVARQDKISFIMPSGDGFSQFMLGGLHFTGPKAGADIKKIALRRINPADVVPNAAPIANAPLHKRDAAAVVRDMGQGDDQRFIDHYAQHRLSRNVVNARALMMFYAHGFEKGLSRNSSFRPGFGEASMKPLAIEMNKWLAKGRKAEDSLFQIAASVMNVYFTRHREANVDVSHFWKLFDPAVQKHIEAANPADGGSIAANLTRELPVSDLPERSFADVAFGRRSVREFNGKAVADEDIRRAVNIAMQAPSVCNRQPVRVHQIDDPDLMRAVLELQGGFKGYKLPPKLVLITSDLSVFVGAVERNQGYIDGGLFMMLFLLALEELGLGGCSLNTAMNLEREAATRKLLNLPESQIFISYVAVGQYDPAIQVPRSKRIGVDEVLIRQAKG